VVVARTSSFFLNSFISCGRFTIASHPRCIDVFLNDYLGDSVKIRTYVSAAIAASMMFAVSTPALAQTAPKPGASCSMSGMAVTVKGMSYVCQANNGANTWGRGLPVSKSTLKTNDTWAKAASSGMTAAFGTITNPTKRAIRVVAARSPYSPMQIHQTGMVDGAMKMMQKPGGLVIPAGETIELKPGGDHLMLMKLNRPIKAGTRVPITLITSTGATLRFTAIGKNFAGANESYDENHGGMNHGGMAMN
jgi:periplasmic copper chaperone A